MTKCTHPSLSSLVRWRGINDKGEYYQIIGFCPDCGSQFSWREYYNTFENPSKNGD